MLLNNLCIAGMCVYFLLFYIVGVKQTLPEINASFVKKFDSQMPMDKIG